MCVGEFSFFDFASAVACRQGKGKWAKLVIAKTGLSNPKRAVEKKLKTVSVSVEVLKCRNVKRENAVLVLPLFNMSVSGRITYNVLALGAVADFGAQNCQYTTKVDAR
jgi:hypothetical protein